jgi:hypothetical protein
VGLGVGVGLGVVGLGVGVGLVVGVCRGGSQPTNHRAHTGQDYLSVALSLFISVLTEPPMSCADIYMLTDRRSVSCVSHGCHFLVPPHTRYVRESLSTRTQKFTSVFVGIQSSFFVLSRTWARSRQTIAAVVADGVVPPFAGTCALYWTEVSKCGSTAERQTEHAQTRC